MDQPKRIVIVGGVAGGATAAARLRRLDEKARILVLERGPYVSFANCGLPYHVGEVIREERKLLVSSAESFRSRFAVDVRTEHEVVAIDRAERRVEILETKTGRRYTEPYDFMVLAPGARTIVPPVPGVDLPGVFAVRTIPETRAVRHWIDERQPKSAVVIGGGFIGLEMAENLARRGLKITVVEKATQVVPPFDAEMAELVRQHLEGHGVDLVLGDGLRAIETAEGVLQVRTETGRVLSSDLVILSVGVRPETSLAKAAGLTLGPSGGIAVDASMRTSDDRIYAVGDAIESLDVVTGSRQVLALAGPANRQGRIAAEAIAGRPATFRGVQGTSVCGIFGLTAASTGASERALRRAGVTDFEAVYLHPGHHVGYYPGAKPIHLKVLYRPSDGRILGAQALGEEGVDKRIDVLAMAIQLGGRMQDLAEAELCYAPQYGAAKDPINLAGFIGENVRSGDLPILRWPDLPKFEGTVLDVREPDECARGMIPDALNIPLPQLRERFPELPSGRPVAVYCAVGQRAYYAVRLLRQRGIDAVHLPGGYNTYRTFFPAQG